MKKRMICLLLGVTMIMSQSITVLATTMTEIVQQNTQTGSTVSQPETQTDSTTLQENIQAENQLLEAKDTIDTLSEQQAAVQSQISDAYADMVDLMILIAAAEKDIADTNAEIAAAQVQIEQTTVQIQAAEAEVANQYEDMKVRIRYLYEKDWGDIWFDVVLGSKDITTFLNRADYAKKIEEFDRKLLLAYAQKVSETTALKSSLEAQKADLEAQKVLLEAQQADLDARKAELQAGLQELQATNVDFVNQIGTVRAQAAEIIALIDMQDEELERIMGEEADSITEDNWWQPADADSYVFPGGSSGTAIVAFAEQFIGYPYVWGGNSLTNGIDCSHFVYQVLRHCGVYNEGYVTSAGWRVKGQPVASLAEAKAGDVICYSGHVAIYDGKGGIIEAKGSRWGITHDRRADYSTILAIRRFT